MNWDLTDNEDKMVALLEQIAANTGSLDDVGGTGPRQEINIEGQHAGSRTGFLKPKQYVVIETADLDEANDDGSVTLEPGETEELVRYRGSPTAILAVGAADATNVRYSLQVDGSDPVGGETEAPLGSMLDPFSFPDKLGAAIPSESSVRYFAHLDSSASSPVDLTGVLHLEVLG